MTDRKIEMNSFCAWDGETLVLNILGKPGSNRDAIGKGGAGRGDLKSMATRGRGDLLARCRVRQVQCQQAAPHQIAEETAGCHQQASVSDPSPLGATRRRGDRGTRGRGDSLLFPSVSQLLISSFSNSALCTIASPAVKCYFLRF